MPLQPCMEPEEAGSTQPPTAAGATTVPRWRWWVHLIVLTLFPLLIGSLSLLQRDPQSGPALPNNVRGLLMVSGMELAFFGGLFAIAWVASRANASQLMLRWRGRGWPVLLGLGYSIALRLAIMAIIAVVAAFWLAVNGLKLPGMAHARPAAEQVVDAAAMTGSPLYFALTLTLISFVVAGFREELWRAAMLAGMGALFPRQFATTRGRAVAVCLVAGVFGLGHASQGWVGVVITGLLGVGLGAIMLRHRSIWEAVLAHGFFDAAAASLRIRYKERRRSER